MVEVGGATDMMFAEARLPRALALYSSPDPGPPSPPPPTTSTSHHLPGALCPHKGLEPARYASGVSGMSLTCDPLENVENAPPSMFR